MNTQKILKSAASIIIGAGTMVVMRGTLAIPHYASALERVVSNIAKLAITGLVADKTTDYVNGQIDAVFQECEGVKSAINTKSKEEG